MAALPGARLLVVDDKDRVTWFDREGKQLAQRQLSARHSVPKVMSDGCVLVAEDKTLVVLDQDGKAVRTVKHEANRAVPVGDDIVTVEPDGKTVLCVDAHDKTARITQLAEPVAFLVALPAGRVALAEKGVPEKHLHVLSTSGEAIMSTSMKAKRHSAPVDAGNERVTTVFGDKLVVLAPAKKRVTVKLSGLVVAPVVAHPATGLIVVPVERGLVELVDSKGKVKSVRRDPPGSGENESRVGVAADGSVILPAQGGAVHRVGADGTFLGTLQCGALGTKVEVCCLDDGTVVVADAKKLHFLTMEDFGEAKEPVVADVGADKAKLQEHFSSWAKTPACRKVLERLIERVVDVKRGDELVVTFLTDENATYSVSFGPPDSEAGDLPASYYDVARLHAHIVFGEGVPDEIEFGSSNLGFDNDGERFVELCDAGQNWLVFDTKKKNKLGEPCIALVDHGAGLEEASAYATQMKQAFGVPGHLLRALAFRVFTKDDGFEEFSWG